MAPVAAPAAAHPPLRASDVVWSGTAFAVRTNRGLVVVSERGRLACPMGLGAFPSEQLPIVATDAGWLVGTSSGVLQLDARGCRAPGPPRLERRGIQALVASPAEPRRVVAVSADASEGSAVFQSQDAGASFVQLAELGARAFFNSVAPAAAGDPLYLAGERVGADAQIEHFVASLSGGELTLQPLELEPGETRLRMLAVDPARPERVIAGAFAALDSSLPERLLRSEDGGRSWHSWQSVAGLNQLRFSPEGETVWLASEEGLWRSEPDGSLASVPLGRSPSCALPGKAELVVCDALGVQRSADGGRSFEPLLRFADVTAPVSCDGSGAAVLECRVDWEEFASEQARAFGDASGGAPLPVAPAALVPAAAAGDATQEPEASAAGCSVTSRPPGGAALALALLALGCARRQRITLRRSQPNSIESRARMSLRALPQAASQSTMLPGVSGLS